LLRKDSLTRKRLYRQRKVSTNAVSLSPAIQALVFHRHAQRCRGVIYYYSETVRR
jgi:hypothetical protein